MTCINKYIHTATFLIFVTGVILSIIGISIDISMPTYNCRITQLEMTAERTCVDMYYPIKYNFTLMSCEYASTCVIIGTSCVDTDVIADLSNSYAIYIEDTIDACCMKDINYIFPQWMFKKNCKNVITWILIICGIVLMILSILFLIFGIFRKRSIMKTKINNYIQISDIHKEGACFVCLDDVSDNYVTICCKQNVHYKCVFELVDHEYNNCSVCRTIINT